MMRTYLFNDLSNFICLAEENFWDMTAKLCEINYELMDAYDAALTHLNTIEYHTLLNRFKDYCYGQVTLLNFLLKNNHKETINGASGQCYLNKGKVIINYLNCEKAILSALHNSEADVGNFYERTMICSDKVAEADEILAKGLAASTHHCQWLASRLSLL